MINCQFDNRFALPQVHTVRNAIWKTVQYTKEWLKEFKMLKLKRLRELVNFTQYTKQIKMSYQYMNHHHRNVSLAVDL